MRLQCPKCNVINEVEKSDQGQDSICGKCGNILKVPQTPVAQWVVFHDFAIRKILRRGSDGVEAYAHQLSLDRPAILKIMSEELSENPDYVNLFVRRARAASKLNHPNIAPIYLVGREYDHYFVAREAVDLQNLRDILSRQGKLDVGSTVSIFQQIADAMDYAWRQSRLLHGNLKPAYISLSDYGVAKLAEIGIAQVDIGEDPNKIKGTPQYISPEQILGEPVDIRSDVYSLGANMYQCLTGMYPFVGETTIDIFQQHLQAPLTPLHEVDPTIPPKISLVVAKMMAKSPDDRYPDATTLSQDLRLLTMGNDPQFVLNSPPSAMAVPDTYDRPLATAEAVDDFEEVEDDEDDEDDEDGDEILEARLLNDPEEDEEEEDDEQALEGKPAVAAPGKPFASKSIKKKKKLIRPGKKLRRPKPGAE